MILIYNLSGLLVGLAGIILGLAAAVVADSPPIGLLVLGVTWTVLGRPWTTLPDGRKGRLPHIFFIPLRYLGGFVAIMGVAIFIVSMVVGPQTDERAQKLSADEKLLAQSRISGEPALAAHIAAAVEELPSVSAGQIGVLTRVRPNALLVLVRISDLSEFTTPQRREVLNAISKAVESSGL